MTFASPGYFFVLAALLPACAAFIILSLTWRADARRRFGGVATESMPARAMLLLSPALIVRVDRLRVHRGGAPAVG